MKKFLAGIIFTIIAGLLIYFVPKIHLPEYDKCKATHLKFDYLIGEAVLADSNSNANKYAEYNFKAAVEVLTTPMCYSQLMIDSSQTIYQQQMTTK